MKKIEKVEGKFSEKEKHCDFSLHRISRFIQPSLLLLLSRKPSHGYSLIEGLKRLGFHKESMDIGAIYRNLRKLEKEGFVKSFWEKSGGREKRCYEVTPEGRSLLDLWAERIKERKKALSRFLQKYGEIERRE